MEQLHNYIIECLKPRDDTEFCTVNEFDVGKFNSLKQDGIMICKTQPHNIKDYEYIKVGSDYILRKCYRDIDWLHDDNNFKFDESQEPLYRRLIPGSLETVDHPHVITSIIQASGITDATYVEYGVRDGYSLNRVSKYVRNMYGIDILPCDNIPKNCNFYTCTTDAFSKQALPNMTYHFAFIDADHSHTSSLTDFINVYKHIQPGGYIFLHDTYPCMKMLLEPRYCNDCYKTPIAIKRLYPNVEILTFPLNPGVTVVHKPH